MDINIEYRIMGVPSRINNIKYLQKQLDISDNEIFIDTAYHKNPLWTWKQASKINTDPATTHLCIIQDDAVLCNGFMKFCKYIVSRFSNAIWLLYNYKEFNLPKYSLFQPNFCTGGAVDIIPVKYINDIIRTQEAEYPDYIHDDYWICYWAHHNNIPVYSTYPTVIDTLGNTGMKSELDHPDGRNPVLVEKDPLNRHWFNATGFPYFKTHDWSEPISYWDTKH